MTKLAQTSNTITHPEVKNTHIITTPVLIVASILLYHFVTIILLQVSVVNDIVLLLFIHYCILRTSSKFT